jgi:phage-related protein
LIIATHGLIKKTDKTPQGDLDKAELLWKLYFELKDKKK